jgi:hypothetical protein
MHGQAMGMHVRGAVKVSSHCTKPWLIWHVNLTALLTLAGNPLHAIAGSEARCRAEHDCVTACTCAFTRCSRALLALIFSNTDLSEVEVATVICWVVVGYRSSSVLLASLLTSLTSGSALTSVDRHGRPTAVVAGRILQFLQQLTCWMRHDDHAHATAIVHGQMYAMHGRACVLEAPSSTIDSVGIVSQQVDLPWTTWGRPVVTAARIPPCTQWFLRFEVQLASDLKP